jgi:hypothetical protein
MYEIIEDSSPTLDQEGEKVGFSPISTDECEFEHAQPCACSEKMIVDGAFGPHHSFTGVGVEAGVFVRFVDDIIRKKANGKAGFRRVIYPYFFFPANESLRAETEVFVKSDMPYPFRTECQFARSGV